MENIVARLSMVTIGIFWASLNIFRLFVIFFKLGPSKFFKKSESTSPPSDLLNPQYGKHAYMNIGSIKIHYVASGPENAPLMLMVHGFPEVWYSWRYQIKEFQKDFRVVAIDMRGFGDTDKPQGVENYRLDCLVEDLRLFVEALGYSSCVVVSHDWGGAVCWAFAASHPQMVDRLVVMNIPPISVWHQGFTSIARPLQFLSSWYIYFFQLPFLPEYGLSLADSFGLNDMFQKPPMGLRVGKITDEEIECYRYYLRKPGAWTAGINYYRANFYPPAATHQLKFPMPVHIIWGCQDKALTMSVLTDTLKAVPQATLTKVQKASHWVQIDEPDTVNHSIRNFLETTNYQVS